MPETIAGKNKALMRAAIGTRYMTLAEAAEWYGVSERTLRRRIAEGTLPAYRIGPRAIRVSAADVEALAHRIPTAGGGDAA